MSLKLRVSACLLLNDGVLFRTRRFVADYRYTANFVGLGAADELVVLDITRRPAAESRERFWEVAERIVDEAMTPALIGGNIAGLADVDRAIRGCAEGVVVGRAATEELVGEIAMRYGAQACTVALDFLPSGVVQARGECPPDGLLGDRAAQASAWGAGQVLLTSIDRDGSLEGYDLSSCGVVASRVSVPVMIAGGCGNWSHMRDAFAAGASACVTSNIFHINRSGMQSAHAWLADAGVPVRRVA